METTEMTRKQWHILLIKENCERKVSKLLSQRKIENYVPTHKTFNEYKRFALKPLFASFVFLKISENQADYVKKISGVIGFKYWLKSKAVIEEVEIEMIRKFTQEYATVRIEQSSVVKDEAVRMLNGPTYHREGNIVEVKYKEIKISLPTLGYNLIAVIDKSPIELHTQPIEERKTV